MSAEINEGNKEITIAQEQVKSLAQETAEEIIQKVSPSKKIVITYRDTPFRPGGPARLIKNWDTNDEAEVGIYISLDLEELRELQKYIKFVVAHEISHLFTGLFESHRGKLTEEEIKESSLTKIDNPQIDSGQTEVMADLTTIYLAEDNQDSQSEMLESYANLIEYYLQDSEVFLRDEVRFLEVIKHLKSGRKGESNRLNELVLKLQGRIDSKMHGADTEDKKFLDKYQEFIKNIMQYFKDNFSKPGQLDKFIREKLQKDN